MRVVGVHEFYCPTEFHVYDPVIDMNVLAVTEKLIPCVYCSDSVSKFISLHKHNEVIHAWESQQGKHDYCYDSLATPVLLFNRC